MNHEDAKSFPTNKCRHRTRSGRYCRLPALPNSVLCFRHSPLPDSRTDTSDLSAELFGDLSAGQLPDLKSAEQVNQCLSKTVVLLAQGRVSPRRAAVLTFTCSQLLRSGTAMHWEEDNLPSIILNMQQPELHPEESSSPHNGSSASGETPSVGGAPKERAKT
jgi:hypothetical protein